MPLVPRRTGSRASPRNAAGRVLATWIGIDHPYAAAEAIQFIIKRDLAPHSVKLAHQTVATATRIGGLFADFGSGTAAVIGVANTLVSLGLQLFSLDLTAFNESPILGCCLITCADTSAVADMFVADIGLPGWMDRVGPMKKNQMEPLIKIASKNIATLRLQLEGRAYGKGAHVKKGFFVGVNGKALKQLHCC